MDYWQCIALYLLQICKTDNLEHMFQHFYPILLKLTDSVYLHICNVSNIDIQPVATGTFIV